MDQDPTQYWHVEIYVNKSYYVPISSFTSKGEIEYDPTAKLTRAEADTLFSKLKAKDERLFYVAKDRQLSR